MKSRSATALFVLLLSGCGGISTEAYGGPCLGGHVIAKPVWQGPCELKLWECPDGTTHAIAEREGSYAEISDTAVGGNAYSELCTPVGK